MSLSTHYYVLSLGAKAHMLYEAFRDYLIEIEDQGFPIAIPAGLSSSVDLPRLRELALTVDKCLAHYYMHDSLRLVVVGEKAMQSAFGAVTAHGYAVIGRIEGDHTATSTRDLGEIVWPVVKQLISGILDTALLDLEASARRGQLAYGLEAMARLVNKGVGGTLLVEEDYRVRGSISGSNRLPDISPDVDLRDEADDAVDAVIRRVLELGGNVVFMPSGSLTAWNRVVLLLRGVECN